MGLWVMRAVTMIVVMVMMRIVIMVMAVIMVMGLAKDKSGHQVDQ